MKTIHSLLTALATLSMAAAHAEDWQKVAFVGDAKVKTISGLVETLAPESRIVREGENAQAGEILRVWRGAEVVLQMKSSQGLVRVKGPVLVRLAPETKQEFLASHEKSGYVTRAVRGGARYSEDGVRWQDLNVAMVLPEGAKVRPFRDSAVDLYHNEARVAVRVTDHKKPTTLEAPASVAASTHLFAAQAP